MSTVRVGVDIGGTFTDIVFLDDDGRIHTKKVSSSVDDYARAIVDGLREVFEETGLSGRDVVEVLHGTTVASNAILELRGARTGLITTKGFRDVLEIRRLRMPRLYDLTWEKPTPLVERYLRLVVDERINARGEVQRSLDPADVDRAIDQLLAEGIEALAVCLLNSYANPVHEQAIRDAVRRKAPGLALSVSAEVLPEIKEYERTSTTVINAYVMPVVRRYLATLRTRLRGDRRQAPLLIMQSNGGLMTAEAAAAHPHAHHRVGPGRRRRRRPGARSPHGPLEGHHLRHGRHHGQGLDHRGRRDQPGRRVPGGRRHHAGLAPPDRGGLPAAGAIDRPRRGRRGRRLAGLGRRGRSAPGRPAERGRLSRAPSATTSAEPSRPSPMPT